MTCRVILHNNSWKQIDTLSSTHKNWSKVIAA